MYTKKQWITILDFISNNIINYYVNVYISKWEITNSSKLIITIEQIFNNITSIIPDINMIIEELEENILPYNITIDKVKTINEHKSNIIFKVII